MNKRLKKFILIALLLLVIFFVKVDVISAACGEPTTEPITVPMHDGTMTTVPAGTSTICNVGGGTVLKLGSPGDPIYVCTNRQCPATGCVPPQPPEILLPPPEIPIVPACNSACTPTASSCPLRCPSCLRSATSPGYTCQSAPVATPTSIPSPTSTPIPTATSAPTPTSIPTATPIPTTTPIPTSTPTPTPTPDPFNEDMCKCDGIEALNLAVGEEATINAFGKVEGTETLYAKIPSMTFFLYKNTGTTMVDIIKQSPIIPTTLITNTPTLNRYQATWKFNLDADIDLSATYRIQAKLKCSKITAATPFNRTNQNVLAVKNQSNASFLDNIINFFASLFSPNNNTNQPASPTPIASSQKSEQLNLGTFYPATIETGDNCTFVKFRFN